MPVEGSAARAFREAQRVGAAPPPRVYALQGGPGAAGGGGGAFFGAATGTGTGTGAGAGAGANAGGAGAGGGGGAARVSVVNPGAAAPLHERQQYLGRMQKMRSALLK